MKNWSYRKHPLKVIVTNIARMWWTVGEVVSKPPGSTFKTSTRVRNKSDWQLKFLVHVTRKTWLIRFDLIHLYFIQCICMYIRIWKECLHICRTYIFTLQWESGIGQKNLRCLADFYIKFHTFQLIFKKLFVCISKPPLD